MKTMICNRAFAKGDPLARASAAIAASLGTSRQSVPTNTIHKPNGTQQERILKALEELRDGTLNVPAEFIREHPDGNGISARYFKHVMLISECNGRISKLHGKGRDIKTSKRERCLRLRLPPA
jgi:hypothetical protein